MALASAQDFLKESTMNAILRAAMTTAGLAIATQATADVVFYEHDDFQGRSFAAQRQVDSFDSHGFNDRASSVVVTGTPWEVCDNAAYSGRCIVLRAGRYPSLSAMNLNDRVSSARAVKANARFDDNRYAPAPLAPQVTFFESEGFQGRSYSTSGQVKNLERSGFNDRASSAVVLGDRWEVCQDKQFRGRCVVLRPGRYPSLGAMGLNDRVSSLRVVGTNTRIAEERYAPAPVPVYDTRRRGSERLYEANITSSRAVLATSGQRCWVEQEQVAQQHSRSANVPGAIVGAIIGGVLGHQVGSGRGNTAATVVGAGAGGVIGANVGRSDGGGYTTQDVQRCENVPGGAQPAYWDVTYNFEGQEHRVQMASAPRSTVTVNERGEPRM
jgi:uncharacterized protein YcfJ